MLQQYSTALIALNHSLHNQRILQQLSVLKTQVINRTQINTKENILPDIEIFKPSFLIFSSSLPGAIELTDLIAKVKKISIKTKIVLMVNETDSSRIISYITSNVDAIVWSENIVESLEPAVKALLQEQAFLCGRSTVQLKTLLQEQKVENKQETGLLELLTDREKEVLYSLTEGVNYKQISKLLFISESTVKTHINNIFTKLNVNDRTQAVLYALHHGIENLTKKPHLIKEFTNESIKQ